MARPVRVQISATLIRPMATNASHCMGSSLVRLCLTGTSVGGAPRDPREERRRLRRCCIGAGAILWLRDRLCLTRMRSNHLADAPRIARLMLHNPNQTVAQLI